MRILKSLVAAFAVAAAGIVAASAEDAGPNIPNPACKEGECPKFTKGFGATQTATPRNSPAIAQMRQRNVSDRCFVTSRDYCEMDVYDDVGNLCYCTDGYNVYVGVVY